MAERVLETRALNRALLARQMLLGRRRLPVARAVERVGGLQTQYAPSAYIGLWSRLDGFERQHLTRALEQGLVLQGTLMRVTIHMVSARDYPLLTEAVRQSRREWWLRVARGRNLETTDYERVAFILNRSLRHGPMSRDQLLLLLEANGFPKEIWEGVGLWIDLIRVPPSGTWERRRADRYGLAPPPPGPLSEEDGLAHLIRRYLGGFGPASAADISSWAGVPVTRLKPVVERMTLRRFRDGDGGELVDLPRQPIPDPDVVPPIRFLPTWDATLLVHARRTGILPEGYRTTVFNTRNPQSLTTFLVDGAVAGAWRYQGGKVDLEPFAPIPRRYLRELKEEATGLTRFLSS
jgi:hypothetical protein